MKITNQSGISLPLAIWLLHDEYDYINEPNYISATSLLRSTKQIILGKRIVSSDREVDIADFIASRLGTAVHDSIEKAWQVSAKKGLKKLGYPASISDNIVINPSEEYLKKNEDTVPVWMEQRTFREIDGFKIGGKFDMVLDGRLFDYKTTSVWSYIKRSKDDDYAMQGSIYRWLDDAQPRKKIEDDHVYIQFIFTDWQKSMSLSSEDYPKQRTQEHPVAMHSLAETERFIKNKVAEIARLIDSPEADIPDCTDKELWRTETAYKYYANPQKTDGRSSKNFTNAMEANKHMADKGGKGVVKTIPGEVKACLYCPAYEICDQRKRYFPD